MSEYDPTERLNQLNEAEIEAGQTEKVLGLIGNHDRSDRVQMWMLEAGLDVGKAMLVAEIEEELPLNLRPVASPAQTDAVKAVTERLKRAFHCLVDYQQKQVNAKPRELVMSTRAMCLALGFRFAAGAQNMIELAKSARVQKATVDKCLNGFIAELGLPKLEGQRSDKACKRMSVSQKNKWRKK